MARLGGSIIMTSYNRKTYRLDDISWESRPTDTFLQAGVPISYIDYMKTK
jgi:aubergine-like protein